MRDDALSLSVTLAPLTPPAAVLKPPPPPLLLVSKKRKRPPTRAVPAEDLAFLGGGDSQVVKVLFKT